MEEEKEGKGRFLSFVQKKAKKKEQSNFHIQ